MDPRIGNRRRILRSPLGIVLALAVIAAIAVLAALLQPPMIPLVGRAEAVDGDTFRLGDARVRLTGLDAPELDQTCADAAGAFWPCGRQARGFAARLLDGHPVTCRPEGRDRYRRVLSRCFVSGGGLGASIVGAGSAVAGIDYALVEAGARAARRGIWAGAFESPANWRRDRGQEPSGLWAWIRAWFQ